MRRLLAAAAAGTMVVASALLGAGTASAAEPATVWIVHGIPGAPVDVYLDGTEVIPNFEPLSAAGPLEVPAGTHQVVINDAGTPNTLAEATVEFNAGVRSTIVAQYSGDDQPELVAYSNDDTPTAIGQGRIVVRHAANAPAVDIRANGKVVTTLQRTGTEGSLNLPTGVYSVDVVLAGTSTVVIGPLDVEVDEGTATYVQAVGSVNLNNLHAVSFTVRNLCCAPPNGVPAGSGPNNGTSALLVLLLATSGFAAVAIGGRRLLAARVR